MIIIDGAINKYREMLVCVITQLSLSSKIKCLVSTSTAYATATLALNNSGLQLCTKRSFFDHLHTLSHEFTL